VAVIPGKITLTKRVVVPAPSARATVRRCGSTERIPVSTASAIGKKPRSTPKAIFEVGPRPKKSMSDGYQTTFGIA
jgi:hypothetical protein